MKPKLTSLTFAAVCLPLMCATPVKLRAAAINVTTNADSGPGSLRQTIADATGGDTIAITITGTITLTGGELAINQDLSIVGPGAANLAISGGGACRAFNIASNVSVSISNLTIRNCRSASGAAGSSDGQSGAPGQNGGGILNAGHLTMSECVLTNNRAGDGGAGHAGYRGADATLSHDGYPGGPGGTGGDAGAGGAIYNQSSGVLRLDGCTLRGNFSGVGGPGGRGGDGGTGGGRPPGLGGHGSPGGIGGGGGGVFNDGVAILNRCTVSGNMGGSGGDGGNGGAGGNVTFPYFYSGGQGYYGAAGGWGGRGGGVFDGGVTTLTNCTISGNASGHGGTGGTGGNGGTSAVGAGPTGYGGDGGDGGVGGGLYGSAVVVSCTVVTNRAGAFGAGGPPGSYGTTWGLKGDDGASGTGGGAYGNGFLNTILAGNLNGNTNYDDAAGEIGSYGHNLVSHPTEPDRFQAAGDLLYLSPLLEPLADNGGPTLTHAPMSGSPAINAGANQGAAETDQRGEPRIVGGTIDIGAFEFPSPESLISYAWLQQYGFSTHGSDDFLDPDGDHMNNWQEWQADTSPVDGNDYLHITSFTRNGSYNTLWWTSKPTRFYHVEGCASLNASPSWETIFTNSTPGWNNVGFDNTGPQYFYRIRAVEP